MKKRLYELLIKITSVKGIVFTLSTVLMFLGKMEVFYWSFFAAGLVGTRFLEKLIGVKKGDE